MKAFFRRFFQWNTAFCDRIENQLPIGFRPPLLVAHEKTAADIINTLPDAKVIDIGGGHNCSFARHRRAELNTYIIGMDILADELAQNPLIDAAVVADACRPLPLQDGSIDVIVTRSVLEHLRDNASFLQDAQRVLRGSGYMVHVFPCKFSPFALLNQLLPNKFAQRLLYYFFPQWRATCGFKAYYKNCYYPRMISVMKASGLCVEQVRFRYYQSIYFKFFVPLYLLSLLYDLILWRLDVRLLACQMLMVVRKTDALSNPGLLRQKAPDGVDNSSANVSQSAVDFYPKE